MAQLAKSSIVIPWEYELRDRAEQNRRHDAALKAAADAARAKNPGDMVGATISFPVADNYATYMVVKQKPLMVQHVDNGVGYEVSAIMIRGLRLSDVREIVRREQAMTKLFSSK